MKKKIMSNKMFKSFHQKLVHDTASYLDIPKIMRVEYRKSEQKGDHIQ